MGKPVNFQPLGALVHSPRTGLSPLAVKKPGCGTENAGKTTDGQASRRIITLFGSGFAVSIIHRIAVVGPESCGKSTLSAQLAAGLQAQGLRAAHVTEYARAYYADRPYQVTMSDIEAIARGQLQAEATAARQHDWLVCDTTVLTCKIWAEVAFGQATPALLQHYHPQDYVLTLLTAADIPWQPDPLRSHPAERDWLLGLYQAELAATGTDAILLQGGEQQRLQQAWQALRALPAWNEMLHKK